MDSKKRCARCGVINEQQYDYCKNCGEPFKNQAYNPQKNNQFTPITYQNTKKSYSNLSESVPELGGVETEKLEAYVGGKNREKIINRFVTAQATNRKVGGFNWVVFITGSLLVFPFVSSWFFYRKMYKVGAIICAVSIMLTILLTTVNFNYNKDKIQAEYNKIKNLSVEEILTLEQQSEHSSNQVEAAVSLVQFGISLILATLAGQIYFKEATRRIKQLDKLNASDNQIYCLAGLPSAASAILIPLGVRALELIIASAPAVALLFSGAEFQKVLMLLFI